MRLFIVGLAASVVLGCPGNGGEPGPDGGSDAGGQPEARPERVIVSDDLRAYLWVPDGGAPASTDIRVTAFDGGWRLSPSGLSFERPALLFFAASAASHPDAGTGFIAARLISADGGAQNATTYRAAAVGHEGYPHGLGIVRVPHFTDLAVEAADEEQSVEGLRVVVDFSGGFDSFTRRKSEEWSARLSLLPGPTASTYFKGSFRVETSGAVEVTPNQVPDVTTTQPVDLTTSPLQDFNFRLRCIAAGPAAVLLYVWSDDFTRFLLRSYSGVCNTLPVVTQVDPTRAVTPTSAQQAQDSLAAAVRDLLRTRESWLSGGDLSGAMGAASQALPPPKAPPTLTVTWQLECTKCELNVEYFARATVTNNSISSQFVLSGILSSHSPRLEVKPVIGQASSPGWAFFEAEAVAAGASRTLAANYVCLTDTAGPVYAQLYPGMQAFDSPSIECGKGGDFDAIMLSENTRLTKNGTGWTRGAPGATANLIHSHDDVLAKFHRVDTGSNLYAGVTSFRSNAGLSPITLRSSLQTGTATFNGTRYAVTGLTGSAVFATTDTLTVEHVPSAGSPVTLSVAAPPPINDVSTLFGPRSGLRTEVRLADGSFDRLFVSVVAGPPGAPAGQHGVLRGVSPQDMQLSAGYRVAPVLDDETIATLEQLGWSVQMLYIASYRVSETSLFFPGLRPLPVQAGRMFQVTPADLTP